MVIKTLSIPQELQNFLDENSDLSPSKMLQSKIIEIRTNRRMIFGQIERKDKHILFLNKKLAEAGDKIVFLEKEILKLRGVSGN